MKGKIPQRSVISGVTGTGLSKRSGTPSEP